MLGYITRTRHFRRGVCFEHHYQLRPQLFVPINFISNQAGNNSACYRVRVYNGSPTSTSRRHIPAISHSSRSRHATTLRRTCISEPRRWTCCHGQNSHLNSLKSAKLKFQRPRPKIWPRRCTKTAAAHLCDTVLGPQKV